MNRINEELIPDFGTFMNEKLNEKFTGDIEVDGMTITVNKKDVEIYAPSDGWDSQREWREGMEYLADGSNDMLAEPIGSALDDKGVEIDWENGEFDEDAETVTFKRTK